MDTDPMDIPRKTKTYLRQGLQKKLLRVDPRRTILALSIVLGLLFWVIDAALDSLIFYDKSMLESLVLDLSLFEVYIRLIVLGLFVAFGMITSRLFTQRKQAERALRVTQYAIDHVSDPVSMLDQNGNFVYINEALCHSLGYSKKELLAMSVHDVDPYFPASAWPDHWVSLKEQGYLHIESSHCTKGGRVFPVEILANFVEFEGKEYNFALMRDITEKLANEQRIADSLAEKTVLLQEIHHRVANNMQLISSLISLQARTINGGPAQDAFQETKQRIDVMAMIHQQLYQSEDMAQIDVAYHIQSIASHLLDSYSTSTEVELIVNVDKMACELDSVIPISLIVTELVTNSIKHAFTDRAKGKIIVGLQKSAKGSCILSIRDDGVGLPEDIDITETETLGLRLTNILTQQLSGKLEIKRKGGTEFRITGIQCGPTEG